MAEERQHAADPLDGAERREALLEPSAESLELHVDGIVAEPPQHRDARCGRERVPGKGARLVDVATRREPLHQVGPAAEGRGGEATADDLAEDREVGRHPVALLRAAPGDPEPRHHLVEHEERARRVGEHPQRLEEPRRGRDAAHVPGDRLDEDGREPLAVARARRRDAVDVVEPADDRVGGDARGDTRRRGDAERHHAGPGAREQRVDVAVVAARELDHAVAARHGPGQPQRAHRRLRARADEPHHLDRRHGVDDLGGELDLRLGRRAEGRPAVGGGVHGCEGLRVRVPEEQRPPRLHPVDVAVALDVLHPASRAARDEHGLVDAHGAHRAHGRVDAAGDQARRPAPAVRPLPQSHPARSFAQYVTTVPAPARLTAVSASSAAARSSRCPASAAARTIAYSPETW